MSSATGSSLRDELASLKIDRSSNRIYGNNGSGHSDSDLNLRQTPYRAKAPRRRRGFGMFLLSLLIWLIPLSILGGVGYYAYLQYDKNRPKMEVSVGQVEKMTIAEAEKLLSAKGYLESRNQAMIGSMNPGRVESILVEEGAKVKKGDVLAVLEHDSLKALLESREAMVQRSKAELLEEQATLDDKVRREARVNRLREKQSATIDEMDEAKVQRKTSEARIEALKAGIKLMEAQAKETRESIRNMHVYAPFDGTVLTKEAEIGETITPGGMGAASGRGAVVGLANLDLLEVDADIAENLLPRLKVGQPAEVSVTAAPDARFRGRLRLITPMGDRTRGTIKVKVEILDKDSRLFPELAATVHFLPEKSQANQAANSQPEIFIRKEALVEEAGKFFVWLYDRNQSKVFRKEIEVIVSQDTLVRVQKGLLGGESIVSRPSQSLVDGMIVSVAE